MPELMTTLESLEKRVKALERANIVYVDRENYQPVTEAYDSALGIGYRMRPHYAEMAVVDVVSFLAHKANLCATDAVPAKKEQLKIKEKEEPKPKPKK